MKKILSIALGLALIGATASAAQAQQYRHGNNSSYDNHVYQQGFAPYAGARTYGPSGYYGRGYRDSRGAWIATGIIAGAVLASQLQPRYENRYQGGYENVYEPQSRQVCTTWREYNGIVRHECRSNPPGNNGVNLCRDMFGAYAKNANGSFMCRQ